MNTQNPASALANHRWKSMTKEQKQAATLPGRAALARKRAKSKPKQSKKTAKSS